MNAASGSDIQYAGPGAQAIEMPKIVTVAAGNQLDVSDAKSGTIQVMGIYNNGANGKVLSQGTSAVVDETYAYDSSTKKITVPMEQTDAPTLYLVKYERDIESGMKMANLSDKFPATIRLTLYIAVMDPCSDDYKAGYLYIPSFTPDPSVTIGFSSDTQEVDFNGNINLDFCGKDKVLYYIFFPDENAVLSGSAN